MSDDQNKINEDINKDPVDADDMPDMEFEDIGLDEFEDVDNLDDFFEDEGEAGADIFDADDLEAGADTPLAAKGKAKKKMAMPSVNIPVTKIVSIFAVVAVLGGGGYFLSQNAGVKGFVSDLTGIPLGYDDGMASRPQLQPNDDISDPFAENIDMDDMRAAQMDNGMGDGGMDFPAPTPVGNEADIYNTMDDGGMNDMGMDNGDDFSLDMPQPEPVDMQSSEMGGGDDMFELPQPVAQDDAQANDDINDILADPMEAPQNDDMMMADNEPSMNSPFDPEPAMPSPSVSSDRDNNAMTAQQKSEELRRKLDAARAKIEQEKTQPAPQPARQASAPAPISEPEPVAQARPSMAQPQRQAAEVTPDEGDFFAPLPSAEDQQKAIESNVSQMVETAAKEASADNTFDVNNLLGGAKEEVKKPSADLKKERIENAKDAQSDFYEANERYAEILPKRKPGYSVSVSNSTQDGARYVSENKAVAVDRNMSPSQKAAGSAVVKEADDDPLLVAAERAMKLQRYDAALRLYETLETMNPNYARAIKGKAEALRALGRNAEAQKYYQKAKQINPNDTQLEGAILSMQSADNPRAAIHDLLTRHRRDPSNANIAAQIGMAYANMGDYPSSMVFLEKAAKLEKNNPVFWYNLAVAADRAGRVQDAILYYEKALYIDGAFHGGRKINRNQAYDRLSVLRRPM